MQSRVKMQPESDSNWMVPIEVMLGSLNHAEVQACSISIVADELRAPKEDAFKPKVVSIGPLHRGTTRHIQLTEETKWRYMREFLDRKGNQEQNRRSELRLKDCGTEILNLCKIINASYGGNIESEPHELAKIMIVDGCFLLEFLHRLGDYMIKLAEGQRESYSDDPIFQGHKNVLSVLNDITMLENQIPLIVLKKLYRKVFPDKSDINNDHRVANIVREAFGYPATESSGGAHILNLIHLTTVQQDKDSRKGAKQELERCATRLRAAGITIEAIATSQRELVDRFTFDITFKDGVLKIPALYVKQTTEVKWRNLIAWEQSKISIRCTYTSYALFFKGLICCKHDIELLEEMGVIVNESKKKTEVLLKLFRTISKGAEHMDSSYSKLCADLNEYQRGKVTTVLQAMPIITWHNCRHVCQIIWFYWRNWYKILITDHIPTVWKFIGVVAAIALLVLTIMQTYYSSRSAG
ncbi:UPF0481 protein At3g47200-like [Abrus precatorius]|uniref:UPF0481 protein At3g47200-like n=1 Tax=Abrus precatorius TaxID=3816 RepID=A0A8B8K1A9_ABRPR|nr:UPF0481 protein At3g47200-like [Abrus precatorius]